MKYAAVSHVGHVRKVNQDRYLVQREENGVYMVLVADGMGGHVAGEVASELAVSTIADELIHQKDLTDYKERLIRAIESANKQIYNEAEANEVYSGMGTTIVAVLASDSKLWIAHVGDSRAYLWHPLTKLKKLTEDHSLVNELIRRGQIQPEEADNHPQRHMLTRALGTLPEVIVECNEWEWQPQDRLLVCTDGLTTHLTEDQINTVLNDDKELTEQVDTLLHLVLDEGGHDNITMVLLTNEGAERRSQE